MEVLCLSLLLLFQVPKEQLLGRGRRKTFRKSQGLQPGSEDERNVLANTSEFGTHGRLAKPDNHLSGALIQ